ncbi:MAG: hypothetical protein Q7N95_12830 [Alphaproteobacteria bacterium]|nr:hypothetical protein [Alphaproteobacteria bacterium]
MSGIEINTPCPHWQTQSGDIAGTATGAALADQGMGPGDADEANI